MERGTHDQPQNNSLRGLDPVAEARKLMKEARISQPPVDMRQVLAFLNFQVSFIEFPKKIEDKSFVFDFEKRHLFLSARLSAREQNYVMACQVGRLLMLCDNTDSESAIYVDKRNQDTIFDPVGLEDRLLLSFASALLVPDFYLRKFYVDLSREDMSAIFVAPDIVIEERARSLGLYKSTEREASQRSNAA